MLRKKVVLIVILFCISLVVSACSFDDVAHDAVKAVANQYVDQYLARHKPSDYKYFPDNGRFVIISSDWIYDKTENGITIQTLVDRHTKVMYVLVEKFKAGYGISMQVLLDEEGKPLLYEGDLD